MKKKVLSLMIILSAICIFIPAAAEATQYGDYLSYRIINDNTEITITDCDTSATEIVIPNEIDGLPVTSIGDSAFQNCSNLSNIIIPDSITSIGRYAFYYCTRLASVTIPNSVTRISSRAFNECSSLTSVVIPNSVTSIGNHAFAWCSSLTSINVDSGNPAYSSLDGNLFNKDKTELIQYAIGKTDAHYTIPDSVTSIGYSAFEDCSSLTSITIPDSVTSIGNWAFYYCIGLTSATIPDSVTSIGYSAFMDCSSLTSVTIPDSVTNISALAFCCCKNLTSINVDIGNSNYSSVEGNLFNKDKTKLIQYAIGKTNTHYTISDSVTSIGYEAFSYCSSLTSVTIPDSVTNIDGFAFSGCSSLTSVTIPNRVTIIGDDAFSGCSSLSNITIPNSVTSIGGYAFSGCSNLSSITIPNSVINVGDSVFQYCRNLETVMFEYGITNIDNILYRCTGLKKVVIPKSVVEIETAAFKDCTNLTTVEYGGSKEDWEEMYIGLENENLLNATINYNSENAPAPPSTPIPITDAEVIKSETDTTYDFNVTLETPYENCYVYAAVYNKDGALAAINYVPLELSGSTNLSVSKSENDVFVKIFVWSDTLQPVIISKEFVVI